MNKRRGFYRPRHPSCDRASQVRSFAIYTSGLVVPRRKKLGLGYNAEHYFPIRSDNSLTLPLLIASVIRFLFFIHHLFARELFTEFTQRNERMRVFARYMRFSAKKERNEADIYDVLSVLLSFRIKVSQIPRFSH